LPVANPRSVALGYLLQAQEPWTTTPVCLPSEEMAMTTRGPWLHERRWPEIREYLERDDVALRRVGSVEQHGRNLPSATAALPRPALKRTLPQHFGSRSLVPTKR
jgi:hypothetical protein